MMIRRRNPGRDRASFIDSLMVSIGLGTISWVFLIAPYAHDTESNLLTRLTSISYPIMDLLLIAVAVRLAVGAGKRAPSFLLMMVAVMALFATDAIYGWLLLGNGYTPGSGALEVGWIAFYVIFGMAALHPSMRVLSERAPDVDTRLTRPRLILLAGAALMAPGVQAIEAFRGESIDPPVVIGASMLLFLLAIVRMAGLVHSQEQSANRERALRAAGAALVTATNREGIYASTLTAAHRSPARTRPSGSARCRRTPTPSRSWRPSAAHPTSRATGSPSPSSTIGSASGCSSGTRTPSPPRGDGPPAARPRQRAGRGVHRAPLHPRRVPRSDRRGGALRPHPPHHRRPEALASQVSLAVESAAPTEDILPVAEQETLPPPSCRTPRTS